MGIISRDPSVIKSNRLYVVIFWVFFFYIEYIHKFLLIDRKFSMGPCWALLVSQHIIVKIDTTLTSQLVCVVIIPKEQYFAKSQK